MISNELKKLTSMIDESLNQCLNFDGKYQQKIYEAIKYSLFTGGKRLRPILSIKTFELFDKDIKKVIDFACAIEMIHTYSLIHDDLPAMDDDKTRRGNPTNHIVFGEALAILAGDGLLNLAFETMLKNTIKLSQNLNDYKTCVKVMEIISNCSGVEGMIGGQVVDLFANYENMDIDRLNFMYSAKTSALFEASVLTGAILGSANEYEIRAMHEFSKNIGLAYQIKDDFLDIDEDIEINKFTFLTFNTKAKALNTLEQLTENALDELNKLKDRDTNFLRQLTIFLLNREK